jgi:hypothetical protein
MSTRDFDLEMAIWDSSLEWMKSLLLQRSRRVKGTFVAARRSRVTFGPGRRGGGTRPAPCGPVTLCGSIAPLGALHPRSWQLSPLPANNAASGLRTAYAKWLHASQVLYPCGHVLRSRTIAVVHRPLLLSASRGADIIAVTLPRLFQEMKVKSDVACDAWWRTFFRNRAKAKRGWPSLRAGLPPNLWVKTCIFRHVDRAIRHTFVRCPAGWARNSASISSLSTAW